MNINKKINLIKTAVAIGIALLLTVIIIFCISSTPLSAVTYFLFGPVMKFKRLANVIEMMLPLLFTGLSVSLICRTGVFNLASESSFFMGGSIAALLAVQLKLPGIFLPIACICIGGLSGMICMYIPVKIRQKFGSSEIVSSLMLNYLVFYFSSFLIRSFVNNPDSGELRSLDFPKSALLAKILPGTRVHAGLIIGIVFVIVFWFYLFKSKWGFKMRISGRSPEFALYSGLGVSTSVAIAHLLAGLACGVGGACEMLGMYSAFKWTTVPGPGYGWDGIIVATLARNNPALVPAGAFFLAYMRVGADIMTRLTDVPNEIVSIIQGVVIILIVAKSFLQKMERKAVYKAATAHAQKGGM